MPGGGPGEADGVQHLGDEGREWRETGPGVSLPSRSQGPDTRKRGPRDLLYLVMGKKTVASHIPHPHPHPHGVSFLLPMYHCEVSLLHLLQ